MADAGRNPIPPRMLADHGVIGNMETAALVASDGSVDYLCWPCLDSPSIFAALLDPEDGGSFIITPILDGAHALQAYVPDTNLLVTRWRAEAGSVELLDLMPHPEANSLPTRSLTRRIEVTRGKVRFVMRCRPRPDYARAAAIVSATDNGVVFDGTGPGLCLTASVPILPGDGEASADFELSSGEHAFFVLHEQCVPQPTESSVANGIQQTADAWRRWAHQSTYHGRWREMVARSALALKLLTSHEHGSIAAAATFGLPEAPGKTRNWDYRASWIRDASFTIYAFMRLGFYEEAERCRTWFSGRASESTSRGLLRVMYSIDGSKAKDEVELNHFAGYGGARPVRIGNGANEQNQLDIYGELLDSEYLANKYGTAIGHTGWRHISDIVEHVRRHWRDNDAGIWELRDRERDLLHSKLMCWVAIDRAIRLARKRSLPASLVDWSRDRDCIAKEIWENYRHPEHGWFVQERGGTELDAATLMMPLVRFVSATDPVWLRTLDAIGDQLTDSGLVYRYRSADGLEAGEGAFTACTFWYIECLARAGRLDQAHLEMERGIRLANTLGLFSEEVSITGEALGNYPQALTHLAFISAAYFLDRRLSNSKGLWQP